MDDYDYDDYDEYDNDYDDDDVEKTDSSEMSNSEIDYGDIENHKLKFVDYVLDIDIKIDDQDIEFNDTMYGNELSYIKMDFLDSRIWPKNNDCKYLYEILSMLNNKNPIRRHRLESIRLLNINSFYDSVENKQFDKVNETLNKITNFNNEIANKLEDYDKNDDTNIIKIFDTIIQNGFILTNSIDCLFNNTFGILVKLCNKSSIRIYELVNEKKNPDYIKPVENFNEVLNMFVKNDEEINTELNEYYKNTLFERYSTFQTKDDIKKNLIKELSNGLINGLNRSGFLISKERIKLRHKEKTFESNYETFYKSRFNKFIKECAKKIVDSIDIDETPKEYDKIYNELLNIATKNNDNISNFLSTALNYILHMMTTINYKNFLIYHFQFFIISLLIGYYFIPKEIFDSGEMDIETTYFNPSSKDRTFTMEDISHIKIPDKSIYVSSENISYNDYSKIYLLKNINVYLEVFTLINSFLFPNLKTINNVFNEHINEISFPDFSINYIKPYRVDHIIVVANYGYSFYIADDELYENELMKEINRAARTFLGIDLNINKYYIYLRRVFKETDKGFCCFKGNKLVNFIYKHCFKSIITYNAPNNLDVLNFIGSLSLDPDINNDMSVDFDIENDMPLDPDKRNVIVRQVYGSNMPETKLYGGIEINEIIKLIIRFVIIISIIIVVVLVIRRIINRKPKIH